MCREVRIFYQRDIARKKSRMLEKDRDDSQPHGQENKCYECQCMYGLRTNAQSGIVSTANIDVCHHVARSVPICTRSEEHKGLFIFQPHSGTNSQTKMNLSFEKT
jgi:hypothetical protein